MADYLVSECSNLHLFNVEVALDLIEAGAIFINGKLPEIVHFENFSVEVPEGYREVFTTAFEVNATFDRSYAKKEESVPEA